jgi:hypothetical protein
LLSGIDSLDLTCKTPAPKALLADLAELKVEAGGDRRQVVTFAVGDSVFRVSASGLGVWWPIKLEHRFGLLGIGDSANRPAWRVSPAAEALHSEGAAAVAAFWREVIEALTGAPVMLMASRLDVHADFAGLDITEADRSAFVCRSGRQSVEVQHGALETLYFGKGGEVTVRLYDKLAEVQATGKGGYLLGLYGEAGLREGDSVQRVEAQLRRDALRSLGVATAEDAISQAGTVYLYAVSKWLRLTVPGSATRRERAATDSRWEVVQAADITRGAGERRRLERERHTPGLDVIVANVAGWLLRAGESLGVDDLDTVMRRVGLLVDAYLEDKGRDFTAEVRAKLLQFGSAVA